MSIRKVSDLKGLGPNDVDYDANHFQASLLEISYPQKRDGTTTDQLQNMPMESRYMVMNNFISAVQEGMGGTIDDILEKIQAISSDIYKTPGGLSVHVEDLQVSVDWIMEKLDSIDSQIEDIKDQISGLSPVDTAAIWGAITDLSSFALGNGQPTRIITEDSTVPGSLPHSTAT